MSSKFQNILVAVIVKTTEQPDKQFLVKVKFHDHQVWRFARAALFSKSFLLFCFAVVFLFSNSWKIMKYRNKFISGFNFIAQKYEKIFVFFYLRVEKILVILEIKKINEYFLVFFFFCFFSSFFLCLFRALIKMKAITASRNRLKSILL